MNTDLTAIRQRADLATPGPWETNVMYTGMYPGGLAHVVAVATGREPTAVLKEGRKAVYQYRSDWPESTSIVVKDTGVVVAHSTDEYGAISQADAEFIVGARTDIPNLLDRIEALERALVQARSSLERARDWVGWTADCPQHSPGVQDILTGIDADLTEIAGVGIAGADTAGV